jgi:exodeoxyribonuclease-1
MQEHSFLWHDYETFGVNPRRARPAQFAAIRTDAELNEIGEAINIHCQPAPDFLPDPISCLITGITPQHCLRVGLPEYQFAAKIEQELARENTVGVGYNTIRFDDEMTRFLFWRNLIDPYAREWQNNCGRWDILDVVRTAYALRPEGMQWPTNEEGKVSFKLELLSVANQLVHEAAHDALSDVRATIALARLLKTTQPKLFDFCFSLRKKENVSAQIGWPMQKAFLHISGMYPVEQGCLSVVWPLAQHPTNKNEIIVWDLRYDPRELFTLDAETIKLRMFSKASALPEGMTRLPIKSIHINKSPVVISNLKTLSDERAQHWGIVWDQIFQHRDYAQNAPDMSAIWQSIFAPKRMEKNDVDEDLYGGFIAPKDRRVLDEIRLSKPAELAQQNFNFQDKRLEELLLRYRARNFPHTLNADELQDWQELCVRRLVHGEHQDYSISQYFEKINELAESASEEEQEILSELYEYAQEIVPPEEI